MTRTAKLLLLIPFCVPGGSLVGQGLDPALLTRPAIDSWPTYAGDYSQRRYSALRQVDTSNVRHLSLAWVSRLTAGAGGGEGGFFGPPGTPPITGVWRKIRSIFPDRPAARPAYPDRFYR